MTDHSPVQPRPDGLRSGGTGWRKLIAVAAGLMLVFGNPAPAAAEDIDEPPASAAATAAPEIPQSEPVVDETDPGVGDAGLVTPEDPGADTGPEIADRPDDPFIAPEPDPSDADLMQALSAESSNGLPTVNIEMTSGTLRDVHKDKNVKWPAAVGITDAANPGNALNPKAAEFKGRGNSTWIWEKKPYQIKFDKKTSVLGMPEAKAWILLANYAETSMQRNPTAFELANGLGLPGTPQESRFVNLVVNGDYLGLYQLTEKVEVGKDRLDLKDPSGIMVELDNMWGFQEPEELRFQSTTSGSTFVLKDQVGKVSDDNVMDANVQKGWTDIQKAINDLDKELHAKNPNWNRISTLIDVESFARMYLMDEFTSDVDATWTSRFFYKDGPGDVLHAGPVWDYDKSFGVYGNEDRQQAWAYSVVNAKWYGATTANDWYVRLFALPEFMNLVNSQYDTVARSAIVSAQDSIAPLAAQISTAADENYALWPAGLGWPAGADSHAAAVDELESWVSARAEFMDAAYGDASRPVLTYSVASQSEGWSSTKAAGAMQGSVDASGAAKPLEAFTTKLLPGYDGATVAGSVEAAGRPVGGYWEAWQAAGSTVGTPGRGSGLQAVRFRLTGDIASSYDLYYRAYSSSYGWLDWVKNGQDAGIIGGPHAIAAIQVMLVDAGTTMPAPHEGWVQADSGHWRYYAQPGLMATSWRNIGGSWYYFYSSGAMATGWANDGISWYYLRPSGAMVTGWLNDGGSWYYLRDSGAMASGWVNDGGSWYYLNFSGDMATGWLNDGGSWYYLRGSGAMATGWLNEGGTWYYLNSSGAMVTGWLNDGGSWYYLRESGAMATGWINEGGRWYYLNSSGAWV